jgi:hypothetical protein
MSSDNVVSPQLTVLYLEFGIKYDNMKRLYAHISSFLIYVKHMAK